MNTTPPAPVTQPIDPRRRLRELLSVPERDRTEEQWDEIVELEIQLAPGNRASLAGTPTPVGKSGMSSSGGGNGAQQPRKHRPKTNNNNNNPRRPNKPNKPPREPS